MVILNVADPIAAVAPHTVDGSEQLIRALDAGLTREAHESVIVARVGSRVTGALYPLPIIGGHDSNNAIAKAQHCTRRAIQKALRERAVDVIHLHGVDALQYLPESSVPIFLTMHLPLWSYPRELFDVAASGLQLICVSEDQRRRTPRDDVPLDVICGGVDLQRFFPRPAKEGYVVLLGLICPETGMDLALRAAHSAGVAVRIAGHVLPHSDHEGYFDEVVLPLLDQERQLIGPVAGADRRELLARARAVIVPSQFDETTSVTVMEALASGTPVVATRRGALPSLVEDGITGWLADDVDAMAEALRRVDEISPVACRAAAEDRFDVRRTRAAYLARYTRARAGNPHGRDIARRRVDLRVSDRTSESWLMAFGGRRREVMEPRMGIEPTTC